jgi:transposase
MARFKHYDYSQHKLIPISFSAQVLPGSFEYTLNYLIDHEVDLSVFAARYRNDETGAPAYDPAILLKVILYAYSRGVVSSRAIERLCRENVVMMALSADTQPHFTTIADFVSSCTEEVAALFRDVLIICDELGLIGKELFAIDGCKLPSNASKEWSGTKADLHKKKQKMERAVRFLLNKHRQMDRHAQEDPIAARERRQVKTLRAKVKKLKQWLDHNDDKPGKSGKPKQSNLTDNESAKMKSAHGVIQGYDGVAAVDAKHQVIVHAVAFGEAQEHELLVPMVAGTREHFRAIGQEADIFKHAKLTADAGFHTEKNMQMLFEQQIDGYVADILFRKRDPRFAKAARYKVRQREERERERLKRGGVFTNRDFHYDPERQLCICPAGKKLYRNGSNVVIGGYRAVKFTAPKRACRPCALRAQCLRHPDRSAVRQVAFFKGAAPNRPETFTSKMKRKIDSAVGRATYAMRLATAEPVFANITSTLGLNRFTLRGKRKVNTQWLLYCLVHNIGKIQRYAPGFT